MSQPPFFPLLPTTLTILPRTTMSASAALRSQECAAAAAAADHHHDGTTTTTTTYKPQPQQTSSTSCTATTTMGTMLRFQQGLTLHDIVGLKLSLSVMGSSGPAALPRRPTTTTAPPPVPAPVTPDQHHHHHYQDLAALPLMRPRPPLPTTISIRPTVSTMAATASDDDSSPLLPFLPLALDDDMEEEGETNAKRQRRPFVLKQRFSNDLRGPSSCLDDNNNSGIQVPPTMTSLCRPPPAAAPQPAPQLFPPMGTTMIDAQSAWVDEPQEQEQAMEVDYGDLPLMPEHSSSSSSSSDESPLRLRYLSSLHRNPFFRCDDDHDDDDDDDVEPEMLYYYDY